MLAVSERYLNGSDPQRARAATLTSIATGFSGGLGNTHEELCGALSGGVMLIGALVGRSSGGEDDRPAIELAARYRERFLETFGYTQCSELREHVIDPPDGLGSCGPLVERAAMLLMRLLDEER